MRTFKFVIFQKSRSILISSMCFHISLATVFPFSGFIYYYVLFGGFCPTLLGLYNILSSPEVFVPLCWVYISLCSLRRFLSHFVGFISHYVLFGGFVPLCWVYISLCPLRGFLSHFVGFIYYYILFGGFFVLFGGFCPNVLLGCSLVCLATQGWIRGDNNLSAIASPCKN